MAIEHSEETALSTTQERSGEVQAASLSAAAMREVEARVGIAKRYPRNEERAYARLMEAMKYPKMADAASYLLPWLRIDRPGHPDHGKPVTGPSVHLARLMASIYGNMASGNMVVASDEETDTVRGFCWDLESNYFRLEDVQVNRIIPRKKKGGETELVVANQDQRMRNAANYGGRKERNCILRMMRPDVIEDALEAAKATVLAGIKTNPDAAIKAIIKAYGDYQVSVDELQAWLGHPIGASTAEEIAELRQIFVAIRSGEAKWADYARVEAAAAPLHASVDLTAVKPSDDPNRGHGHETPPMESSPAPQVLDRVISEEQALELESLVADHGRTPEQVLVAMKALSLKTTKFRDVPSTMYSALLQLLAGPAKVEEPPTSGDVAELFGSSPVPPKGGARKGGWE